MVEKFEEGKAILKLDRKEIVDRKMPVFYNPKMKLNKDITIEILNNLDGKHRCGLPLAGSGVRAIRLLKECKNIMHVCANDISKTAYQNIKDNCKGNGISFKEAEHPKKDDKGLYLFNEDANMFLLHSLGYSYIDVDPFGDPNPFLDSAVKRISRGGILAVTATDTAALCGTYPKVCLRKYNSKSLLNDLCYETGVRILIRKVQIIASQYDKAAVPIYSYYDGHYMRAFFRVDYTKQACDNILKEHKYLLYCPKCLERKFSGSNIAECCGQDMQWSGLLYSGKLWDSELALKIKGSELAELIASECEIKSDSYYNIHEFCKKYKISELPKNDDVIEAVSKMGYKISPTHFSPVSVRTDMPVKEFVEILKIH